MSQKGSVPVIFIILILGVGLILGLYLVSQNTSWFSFAGSSQIYIPKTAQTSTVPKATPLKVGSESAVYQNPFDQASDYQNPFDSSYENPFNNL